MKYLSQKLIKLVELLYDGDFHDAVFLGDRLGITYAAVGKLIKKLQAYDILITSIKEDGYKLESKLILMDINKIQSALRHKMVQLKVLEKTKSTNDVLKKYVKINKQIIACFSETQTLGRGRLNRQWHSPFGKNIYLSLLYPFQQDISDLSGLSLVVALAIAHAIEVVCPAILPRVKWPNDLMITGCKFAGILIEIEAQSYGFFQAIIGVGVNVNMQNASKKHIDQDWISLFQVMGYAIDRNLLGAKMIDTLLDYLKNFSEKGMSFFKEEWKKRDCLENSIISVQSAHIKTKGRYVGINDFGHLLLQTETGEILSLASGEASILR